MLRSHRKYSIPKTMHLLNTLYGQYFVKKYKMVGAVFQGRYWSEVARTLRSRIFMARYITRNPKDLPGFAENFLQYPWSSHAYLHYEGNYDLPLKIWPNGILRYFPNIEAYEEFVLADNREALKMLQRWWTDENANIATVMKKIQRFRK